MSEAYAIKTTTLTAIGDAIRSKVIGTSETPAPISKENVSSSNGYMLEVIEFPKFVKTVKVMGRVNDVDMSDASPQIVLQILAYASGAYIRDREVREASDFTIINPDWNGAGYDYEITVDSNALTFVTAQGYNTNGRNFTFSYTAIGLDENGNEFKYTPLEMVDKINGLGTDLNWKFPLIVSRATSPSYDITAEELGDIDTIGYSAFYTAGGLQSIELPDSITKIDTSAFSGTNIQEIVLPAKVVSIGNSGFQNCKSLETIKILNDTSVITCTTVSYNQPFSGCSKLTSIHIPSKLYNAYCSDAYWSQYKDKFIAVGEWAFDPQTNPALLFNQSVEVSIQLQSFAITPEFSITSSNEEVATISNVSINEDNTLITYTINSLAVEGSSTITVNIIGENNTFTFINNVRVYETIPDPTYEVVAVDGATYGFALREDGYWESQNFKVGPSGAVCQVNISNPLNLPVYFDCINYAEANYDYGILGAVNQVLTATGNDDSGVKKNFKGLSKADIQTVEYLDASGDCFIQVKFRKDSSGDQNNDSIRFKVRFGE